MSMLPDVAWVSTDAIGRSHNPIKIGTESQMFTGLVEEMGTVRALGISGGGTRLEIGATLVLDDAEVGSSISVNGCCLTVVDMGRDWWAADVVPETLDRTTIGRLQPGDRVNLERPLAAAGRYGGHIVQGHVDATSAVTAVNSLPDGSWLYEFGLPDSLAAYIVEKGSVAVDGVSLTVAAISRITFSIAIIPHTHEMTVLGQRLVGDLVNIEADVVAKYVERQIRPTLEGDQP